MSPTQRQSLTLPETAASSAGFEMQGGAHWIPESGASGIPWGWEVWAVYQGAWYLLSRKLLLLGGFCTSQEKRLLQCRVWSWQPLLYNCPQIPSTRLSSGDFSTHHPPSTNTWGECLGNGNPAQQPFKKRWLCLRQAHILPGGWKPCSWMVNGWLFQALIVWAGEPKLRSRPLSFQGQPPQQ